jgi:hypothetical protein
MTQDPKSLDEKRTKALQRLRGNRGKERSSSENRQKAKGDSATLLLKEYRDGYRQEKKQLQEAEEIEILEAVQDPEQLPRLMKAADRLQEKEDTSAEALQRLKDVRQRIKQARQAKQAQLNQLEAKELTNPSAPPLKHQQLLQDALSADFFKSASQWLGNIRSDPHLSSTPLEEIELLYDQAKYRYKVLKLLLDDTQKELDSFEAYLRMAKSSLNPPN